MWKMAWGECTSDGFAKVGMAVVGMGGSVYTMKSADANFATAARRRSPVLPNIIASSIVI
jgi:hypothetical protein